jgi:hypothetical protein
MPRLTAAQYRNVVRDVFGDTLPAPPLPQDTNPYLFYNIGATSTSVSDHGVEQYADAAYKITDAVFDDAARREALIGCRVESPGDPCTIAALTSLGRKLYRRPLTQIELARWGGLAQFAGAEVPADGLKIAVAGMLQSSHFLYRIELGEDDPDHPDRRRYTSLEMASRLSFLLWDTAPDDELLAAGERGDLVDPALLYDQAERLVASPRGRTAVQDFFSQYLDLGRLGEVNRDPAIYPGYTPSLPAAMETEIRLLVDDLVFRRDGDIRELYYVQRSFVNSELARLYELEVPGATPVTFVPVEFPEDSPRAGLLTLGAFLTMNAHPSETSPTLRGKYVRERILCQQVPVPPDDVDLNLKPGQGETRTLRERLEQHRKDPACVGCHLFLDPPGFLFESFDSVGRFRTEVDGYDVDTSGELDGVLLNNAKDLAMELKDNPQVPACLVRQLYRHGSGRLETESEAASLAQITEEFAADGYRFRALLVAMAMSEGYRTLSQEDSQ